MLLRCEQKSLEQKSLEQKSLEQKKFWYESSLFKKHPLELRFRTTGLLKVQEKVTSDSSVDFSSSLNNVELYIKMGEQDNLYTCLNFKAFWEGLKEKKYLILHFNDLLLFLIFGISDSNWNFFKTDDFMKTFSTFYLSFMVPEYWLALASIWGFGDAFNGIKWSKNLNDNWNLLLAFGYNFDSISNDNNKAQTFDDFAGKSFDNGCLGLNANLVYKISNNSVARFSLLEILNKYEKMNHSVNLGLDVFHKVGMVGTHSKVHSNMLKYNEQKKSATPENSNFMVFGLLHLFLLLNLLSKSDSLMNLNKYIQTYLGVKMWINDWDFKKNNWGFMFAIHSTNVILEVWIKYENANWSWSVEIKPRFDKVISTKKLNSKRPPRIITPTKILSDKEVIQNSQKEIQATIDNNKHEMEQQIQNNVKEEEIVEEEVEEN